jgi:hypothetical protein
MKLILSYCAEVLNYRMCSNVESSIKTSRCADINIGILHEVNRTNDEYDHAPGIDPESIRDVKLLRYALAPVAILLITTLPH